MKLVKSLLLGSAAGLCAVAGVAQAADLPMRAAAPVEYVRVCSIHGVGFFYIPGTDTCIRIGGRARYEYGYFETKRHATGADTSMFRGLGRLQVDARTATQWGTLRTFIRFDTGYASGAPWFFSGSQVRGGFLLGGNGVDTTGRAGFFHDLDKAFIQFAGLTAGRASSFFDFYVTDVELINGSLVSNVGATNLIAYTATLGGGFSATLSLEDPIPRRNPIFTSAAAGSAPTSPVQAFDNGTVIPGVFAQYDIAQRNNMPDVVGVLRVDQPWGSAQLSGAVHEVSIGLAQLNPGIGGGGGGFTAGLAPTSPLAVGVGTSAFAPRSDAEFGYAVQGGVKINLPMIAPGDALWLQAAYAKGASRYSNVTAPFGYENGNKVACGGGCETFVSGFDGVLLQNGQLKLTESWAATAAFLHYWTPQWRSGFVFSYGEFDNPTAARISGPLGNISGDPLNFNFKDWTALYVSGNLIWSPVAGLDIGVEVLYYESDPKGRVTDLSKGPGFTVGQDDHIQARLRIERTF